MICLQCDSEQFIAKPDAIIEQHFKGKTLHVQTPAMACTQCGWITLAIDQIDELRRKTILAYNSSQ